MKISTKGVKSGMYTILVVYHFVSVLDIGYLRYIIGYKISDIECEIFYIINKIYYNPKIDISYPINI